LTKDFTFIKINYFKSIRDIIFIVDVNLIK